MVVEEDGEEQHRRRFRGAGKADVEKVPFYRLFAFADSKDVALIVLGTIGAIGNGLSMPLITFIYGDLINAFATAGRDDAVRHVSKVAVRFVYLAVVAGVSAFLQAACWMVTGGRQAARIRLLYLKAILRQDIAFFDNETTTGEVIGRMSGDTILIQEAMGEKVGKFLQFFTAFIGGYVIAFIRGWLLTLVMIVSFLLILAAGGMMSLTISKLSTRGQAAYAEAGTVVEQTVGSIRTVVSFNGENQAIEKYNQLIKAAYKSTVDSGIALGLGVGSVLMIIFCSYGLGMWYGSKLVLYKGYNGGTVINVVMAVMMGGMSLGQTSPCLAAFGEGKAAAFKLFETIERRPSIDVYDTSGLVLEDIKGDIVLKDVCFIYPARPDQKIFNGFSLHVPCGTTMALVGASGSGKSTVIALVERFYDPYAGELLIDGINLKDFNLKWIRERIGLVSQEPVLFNTTIRENIAYGKENATSQEISRAIELANAAKFISKMPKGLNTMAGEHGTQLSGGQKQRIAIARAILKNPKILLLDEATSALDAESERIVQEALERIMLDQTTVVVAHRLSTVRNADRITVMQQGKLIEQGSHSDLIKNPAGAYSQLIRLQEVSKQSEDRSFHVAVPVTHSGSSPCRSMSRGSSFGGTSRHLFTIPLDLPGALAFEGEVLIGDEPSGGSHSSGDAPKPVSIKRLASLNKPEMPVLIIGAIAASLYGVTLPVFGLLLSIAIRTFYEPRDALRKDVAFWALMFAGLGVLCLLLMFVQQLMFAIAGGKLVERIRSLSFERVVHQDISWFDHPSNSSGAVGARLSTDAFTVKSLVGDTLGLTVQNLVTIIAGFVIAMVSSWRLALVVTASAFPCVILQGYAQVKLLQGFGVKAKVLYEEASQVASDAVGNMRTVASFCSEGKVMGAYESKCDEPVKAAVRQGVSTGVGFGLSFFVLFCSYALCFWAGAIFTRDGKATFAEVFKVFFALTMAASAVSHSGLFSNDLTKAKNSAASIFSILDRRSLIDSSSGEGANMSVAGDIQFKDVSFKYPTRPDTQIFKNLCLTIPSGKKVALVGESGSGKSTTIALLERFYDPDSGTVLLDGTNIQDLNVAWLRRQMGLVSQEPVLFGGTIRDNIAYGRQGVVVSEEEVISAATAANVHAFISSLPQGYDTPVGERGVQLSGGQKQRIAIARAIIKDPRILLLDEATSALDAESERVVQETLDKVMVGRTAIVVAHRLSTITGADMIAVIKNGAVMEQGRHGELAGISGGAYASLVALQSSE